MNQLTEGSSGSNIGRFTTGIRPFRDEVSPPPYSSATSSSPNQNNAGEGFRNEKLGVPQGLSMDCPPSYYSPGPQVVTHVFVDVGKPASETTCCGCMTLQSAATGIALGKVILCIISLVTLGILTNDRRWGDHISRGYEEIEYMYELLVAALVIESVLLLGNLIGVFGAIQKNAAAVLICIILNVATNVIVIITTNVIEPMGTVSLGTLIGIALEAYLCYILIRFYKFLKATKRTNPPARELVDFAGASIPTRPNIIRNL